MKTNRKQPPFILLNTSLFIASEISYHCSM